VRLLGAVLLLVLPVACGDARAADEKLLVSAAASLTDVFAELEIVFEAANPSVDVVLNFGSSSTLREQILEGAPADVYASADISNMDQVVAAGETVGEPRIFARNLLQIAVPAGNPAEVTGLADFADEELLLGLCARGVPCGDFARKALTEAGVVPAIDTNEPNVRSLLTKVEAGELDAAITYVTDVGSAAGDVEGIDIPEDDNVLADYPIVALADAMSQETASAFIAFVLSSEGRAILAEFGFVSP
jgi:molybdate transport system substrate-binding protein